jgi:hypothetical protein
MVSCLLFNSAFTLSTLSYPASLNGEYKFQFLSLSALVLSSSACSDEVSGIGVVVGCPLNLNHPRVWIIRLLKRQEKGKLL